MTRDYEVRRAVALEVPVDVRQGARRDAIIFCVGANASQGLRRTNADKRRAVMVLLNDPKWSAWSNREIARHGAVDDKTVAKWRNEGTTDIRSEEPRTHTTKHGTTATMNTANIGAGSKPDQEAPAADPHRKGISTLTREGLEDGVTGMRAALADEARQGPDRVEQGEENTIGGWLAYGNALSQLDTADRMDRAHLIFGI